MVKHEAGTTRITAESNNNVSSVHPAVVLSRLNVFT